MQTNLSISQSQTNFKAQIEKNFINNAKKFYKGIGNNKAKLKQFEEKVNAFKDYGYDDYFIKYVKKDFNGEQRHMLIAVRNGMADTMGTVLTSKDKFRKVVEKFLHINKWEFTTKMEEKNKIRFANRVLVD